MENCNQKKKWISICLVMMAIMLSCQNTAEMRNSNDSVQQAADTAEVIIINSGTHCFAYFNNKDSIVLSITINGKSVTGRLLYSLHEKDKNEGTIKGRFFGDTLLADYSFASEGIQSVRQVAFLRKGNIFQEGYGSTVEKNGRLLFANLSQISFTGNNILLSVDCKSFSKKW